MIHKIGHLFDKPVTLNLLPHIQVPKGYLRCRIDFTTIDDSNQEYNSTEYNTGFDGLDVVVGSDVHSIAFWLTRHNSYPSGVPVNYHAVIRIDRLIMLNMICKLLKKN